MQQESRISLSDNVLDETIIDPRTRRKEQSALDSLLFAIGQDGTHHSFRLCQDIYNYGRQGFLLHRRRQKDQAGDAWGNTGKSPVFDDPDSGPVDFVHWQERPRGNEEKSGIMIWDRRQFLLEYPKMPLSHVEPKALN